MSKYTKKAKAHTRYVDDNGKRLPGVTTILGILNKPALVPWANKLGLEGIDVRSHVDGLAEIGTVAHYLIECYLSKRTPDLGEYSPDVIDKAENAAIKYYDWEARQVGFEVIGTEMKCESSTLGYGGTIDLVCKIGGKVWLVDFKTGKGIYEEHDYQVAAYAKLLEVCHGIRPDSCMILRIGRDTSEGFEEHTIDDLGICRDTFEHALAIYNNKKERRRK